MKQRLQGWLDALSGEYAHGQNALVEFNAAREELTAKLLRISGAIQVLEEELNSAEASKEASGGTMHLALAKGG